MKQFILNHKKSIAGISACLLVGMITLSFQDSPFVYARTWQYTEPQDTTPKKNKRSMTMKEFDQLSENLDKEIASQVKEIDLQKIEMEVAASLRSIDFDKISKEVEASLKDINTEKILADVKKEMANIDLKEINAETQIAFADAQKELIKAQDEIKNINKDQIRKEIENAKLEVEKSKSAYRKIDFKKIMSDARDGIDEAKFELKQLKTMFNEMEKDGLIDQKKGFNINYKNKELFINGARQSVQVTDKYRKYFKDDSFEITIEKE